MTPDGTSNPRLPHPAVDSTDQLLAGARNLNAQLERWAAEAAVDEAADRRARQRWLRQQASEQATVAGILVDLAEQRLPVTIDTTGRRKHRAMVAAVGADFVALQTERGCQMLLAVAAIGAVRPHDEAPRLPTGDRDVQLDLQLHDAIAWLAADRPLVVIATPAAETVSGTLLAVGLDLVTIATAGPTRRGRTYVPVRSIAEIARQ